MLELVCLKDHFGLYKLLVLLDSVASNLKWTGLKPKDFLNALIFILMCFISS